tara:strand:- start:543 stop:1280 length:738 start_codon:yes stop_codon:yes gene_type:complete
MANAKEYSYFVKGNNISIVEKDIAFDNDPNSKDYGPGSEVSQYKSPLTSVSNGLEIEYVYSPKYWINNLQDTFAITHYGSFLDSDTNKYHLSLVRDSGNSIEKFPEGSFPVGSTILLRNADKFNGLHVIKSREKWHLGDADMADTVLVLETLSGENKTNEYIALGSGATIYWNINLLKDENDEIPVPEYLSKAIVYYVKAKLMEDVGKFEEREYFLKEFRKSVEKHESSKVAGPRRVIAGLGAIR